MPRHFGAAIACLMLVPLLLGGCSLDSTTITNQNDHPQNLSVKITVDAVYQGDTKAKAFAEFFRQGKAVQFAGNQHVYLQRHGDPQNELGLVVSGTDVFYTGMVTITDDSYDFLYVSDDQQQWSMKLYASQSPTFFYGNTASVNDTAEFNYTIIGYNDPQMYTLQPKFVGGYVTDFTGRTIAGPLQDGSKVMGPKLDQNNIPYYTGTYDVSPQGTDINGNSGGLSTGAGTIGAYDIMTFSAINSAWGAFTAELASPIYFRTVTWTA